VIFHISPFTGYDRPLVLFIPRNNMERCLACEDDSVGTLEGEPLLKVARNLT